MELISTAEAAERIGVKPVTLRAWHMRGVGPTPVKIANRLLYDPDEIDRYAAIRNKKTA